MNIQELTLYSNNLAKQKQFYSEILGFKLIHETASKISIRVGDSILNFKYCKEPKEQYHFAFNIPSNQENEALTWLKQRVDILKDGDSEIQYFDFWDANAIYFYDKDHNIVEFIARKTLDYNSTRIFDEKNVLNICEMGVPTNNLADIRDKLINQLEIPQYSGDETRFCSIGNETGLFICLNKTVKDFWYPTNEKTYAVDFSIQFEHSSKNYSAEFINDEFKISQL